MALRLGTIDGFGKRGTFWAMLFIIIVLGVFIDWIGIVYIIFPILLPIAIDLGFDPIWFVVVGAVCLKTSFLSTPFGYAFLH